jgi:BolA family transcriptional regulator, general stress-responsive regulator
MGHVPNRTDAPRSQRDGEPHIMNVSELITEKLTEAFAPQSLRVVDESDQHSGHTGHREGGETHFRVYIVSRAFQGKSRLDRHRLINAALARELAAGVHALAIHAASPDEGLG